MAYPSVEAPYGLVPVQRLDGLPYAGATRQYRIASAYATTVYKGDPVELVSGGTIEFDTPDASMTPIGVFMGCTYTDPTLKYKVFSNYWPGGTVASDAMAYVVDDPFVLFKVAVVSSGTTIGSLAVSDIGTNTAMVNNTGDLASGVSRAAASDSTASTNTLPLRIIALVEETKNSSGGYTEAYVKWNDGHAFDDKTGL